MDSGIINDANAKNGQTNKPEPFKKKLDMTDN
jgi:hypothetical protein